LPSSSFSKTAIPEWTHLIEKHGNSGCGGPQEDREAELGRQSLESIDNLRG
jgi:hypothetical protein